MQRVLFVGNSLTFWNKGVDVLVRELGGFTSERIVEPGASLHRLWRNGTAAAKIRSGRWDWVVLQEDLPETSRAQFEEAARAFAKVSAAAHARLLLFMAWAYDRLPTRHDEIVRAHVAIAAELGCAVAPVGAAFAQVREARSDTTLQLLEPDDEHPTMAGTYLAALVIYATLNRGVLPPTLLDRCLPPGVDMETARELRETALTAIARWDHHKGENRHLV